MRNANSKLIGATRLTWQATQRHKLGFYIDYTKNCTGSSVSADGGQCRAPGDGWTAAGPGIGPGVIDELAGVGHDLGRADEDHAGHLHGAALEPRCSSKRGSPRSGRSGATSARSAPPLTRSPVTEQSTAAGVPNSNFIYHGWPAQGGTIQQNANYRASLSYVTGSHNLKVGYQGAYMIAKTPRFVGQQLAYRFNNGVPNQLTQRIGRALTSNRVVPHALFVQDQWTRGRLTLQGGLRYEHVHQLLPRRRERRTTRTGSGRPSRSRAPTA